jgi:hypothetical protein
MTGQDTLLKGGLPSWQILAGKTLYLIVGYLISQRLTGSHPLSSSGHLSGQILTGSSRKKVAGPLLRQNSEGNLLP